MCLAIGDDREPNHLNMSSRSRGCDVWFSPFFRLFCLSENLNPDLVSLSLSFSPFVLFLPVSLVAFFPSHSVFASHVYTPFLYIECTPDLLNGPIDL